MSKNMKRYFVIVGIALVIYNLLIFLIPYSQLNKATFWIAYAGGMVAIGVQAYIAYLAFNKKESLKSALYGFPLARVGALYLVAQLVITLVAIVVNVFVNVPSWILVLLEVILLGLAAIGLIVNETYREQIQKLEKSEPLTTKFIYDLRVDAKMLIQKYNDSPIYNELYKLQQEIQYSDPKSNDSLLEIEDEINRKFIELKTLLSSDNHEEGKKLSGDLLELVQERNLRCKVSKNN